MLHYRTVKPGTLELLKQLMALPVLQSFSLVGGTALSLKLGHRISDDIDLFATAPFENTSIIQALSDAFPGFIYHNHNSAVGVFGYIGEVKIDLVRHDTVKMLEPIEVIDGIRMFSNRDIAAMKIFAILQRARKKDMYDISELLNTMGLKAVSDNYYEKYPNNLIMISISRALTYFEETETDADPVSLNGQTWAMVKKNISRHVNQHLKK